MKELARGLTKALKSRTIQAALIGAALVIVGWFVNDNSKQESMNQVGYDLQSVNEADSVVQQNGQINTVGQIGDNTVLNTEQVQVEKNNPILVEMKYTPPSEFPEDTCNENLCVGTYIQIGESPYTVRVVPEKCKSFVLENYNYDSGAYDEESGSYEKLITNYNGVEVNDCSWKDIERVRILSRGNLLYEKRTEKTIWNYNTIDEFGSIIVQ